MANDNATKIRRVTNRIAQLEKQRQHLEKLDQQRTTAQKAAKVTSEITRLQAEKAALVKEASGQVSSFAAPRAETLSIGGRSAATRSEVSAASGDMGGPSAPTATATTAATTSPPPEPSNLQQALEWSQTQIGAPYVGAASPFRFGDKPGNGQTYQGNGQKAYLSPAGVIGYDCSGFVVAVFRKAGVDLAARGLSSSSGYKNGLPDVPKDQLQPGDLLTKDGHVVIYIGDNKVIESTPPGVRISDASKFVNDPAYVGRRVPPEWYGGTAGEQATASPSSAPISPSTGGGGGRGGVSSGGGGGGRTGGSSGVPSSGSAPASTRQAPSAPTASMQRARDAGFDEMMFLATLQNLQAMAEKSSLSDDPDFKEWAAKQGYTIPPGGEIPPEILSRFLTDRLVESGKEKGLEQAGAELAEKLTGEAATPQGPNAPPAADASSGQSPDATREGTAQAPLAPKAV